jgi:hypothetical protein
LLLKNIKKNLSQNDIRRKIISVRGTAFEAAATEGGSAGSETGKGNISLCYIDFYGT